MTKDLLSQVCACGCVHETLESCQRADTAWLYPAAQAVQNPGMAAATTGMSDALQEEQEELREQLEVALQECAVLKDEVTALTQVSTTAEHRSRGTVLIALAHLSTAWRPVSEGA